MNWSPARPRGTGKVLIDSSNLHSGGGVQVAASFLDEIAALVHDPQTVVDFPWLVDVDVEVSSAVTQNVQPSTVEVLKGVVTDRRPRHLLNRRARGYEVSFTVFGPEYGYARARHRVLGFADSTVVQPRPKGVDPPALVSGARQALRSWTSRRLFASADVIVVETEATAMDVRDSLSHPSDVRVVPNTTNRVFSEPHRWGEPPGLSSVPGGRRLLAYIARAYPHKNIEFLGAVGDALVDLLDEPPIFLLTLPEREWSALSGRTRHHCHNLGSVSIGQVPAIYRAVDAAIFPSLQESFSAMPIEAMTMDTAVFASDRPFVRTTCGEAPLYFDPLDPLATAALLARSLPDERLLAEHVRRGYEVVTSLPSATDRARAYVTIVDSLLSPAAT